MFKGRRILVSALAATAALLPLAGCGQRGPLYLPTGAAAAQSASLPQTLRPAPAPASAAEAPLPPASLPSDRP